MVQDSSYKVIKASITYYKGNPGDEVVLLVPEDGDSLWGAVENVIPAGSEGDHAAYYETGEASTTEADLDPSHELPSGDEAQLPPGDAAELPSGDAAQIEAGDQTEEVSEPESEDKAEDFSELL